MNERILFVEDDESLGFITSDGLEQEGFEVDWLKNGEDAFEKFCTEEYQLCILDVMMPKMDGFSLAQKIRKQNEFIPLIFLTARSKEEDRLKGFEIGGDDYVQKPFSMAELVYRVKVFLRRTSASAPEEKSNGLLQISIYQFDPSNHFLKIEDKIIRLTYMESQLLKMLVDKKNELVKREDILVQVWGENDYFKGRSLDVFISRLRKYLNEDSTIEIKNHHGIGFSLKC